MSDKESKKETKPSDLDSKISVEIDKIVEICEKIPSIYRISCFEILLKSKLSGVKPLPTTPEPSPESPPVKEKETTFEVPIDVRAFLSQFELDESVITKLFLIENKEIRPKFTISTTVKSKAQLQVALLLALENSIKNPANKFEFASEDVRERCRDLAILDGPNFATHFKNNKKLFKSLSDLEKISLSPDGKSELAEVISQITNG